MNKYDLKRCPRSMNDFRDLIEECKKTGKYTRKFHGEHYCGFTLKICEFCEDIRPNDDFNGYKCYCRRERHD